MRESDIEAADRRCAELAGSHAVVPAGHYCYGVASGWKRKDDGTPYFETAPCPYWALDLTRERHESGYCALLKEGDWTGAFGMLWDQLKLCDINFDDEDPRAEEVSIGALSGTGADA